MKAMSLPSDAFPFLQRLEAEAVDAMEEVARERGRARFCGQPIPDDLLAACAALLLGRGAAHAVRERLPLVRVWMASLRALVTASDPHLLPRMRAEIEVGLAELHGGLAAIEAQVNPLAAREAKGQAPKAAVCDRPLRRAMARVAGGVVMVERFLRMQRSQKYFGP